MSASSHPHFDDGGALDWYESMAKAKDVARSENKMIFIEFGRELCSQCKTLVEAVLPRPDVAPLLKENFVAVASDCDDPEDEVIAIASELEDAMMLPFVLFADADGKFIDGYSGVVTPPYLIKTLQKLVD